MINSFSLNLTPDTLRLLIIPLFAYGAYLDFHTRRVYNEFWIPIIGLSFLFLGWDIMILVLEDSAVQSEYLFNFALSVIVTPSIAYTLWQNGLLGGADLKAIATLSVFFPTTPQILINSQTYPLVEGIAPIFTITILINALIISMAYQIKIGILNLKNNACFNTHTLRIPTEKLQAQHGELITEENTIVDLDSIRMYLNWRNTPVTELQTSPRFYRRTQPAVSQQTIDGAVKSSIKKPLHNSRNELPKLPPKDDEDTTAIANAFEIDEDNDPWAIKQFYSNTNVGVSTNTSPEQLEKALDEITTNETITIEPSIPFFIPLTISLLISVTYGSILIGVTEYVSQTIINLI